MCEGVGESRVVISLHKSAIESDVKAVVPEETTEVINFYYACI